MGSILRSRQTRHAVKAMGGWINGACDPRTMRRKLPLATEFLCHSNMCYGPLATVV